jgi:hypothetical protein
MSSTVSNILNGKYSSGVKDGIIALSGVGGIVTSCIGLYTNYTLGGTSVTGINRTNRVALWFLLFIFIGFFLLGAAPFVMKFRGSKRSE